MRRKRKIAYWINVPFEGDYLWQGRRLVAGAKFGSTVRVVYNYRRALNILNHCPAGAMLTRFVLRKGLRYETLTITNID
jgi:hypothetical protein